MIVSDGIRAIDTGMAGQRELNAVYLIGDGEPCLVESGPGADGPVVAAALDALGIGPADLAHIVVTHIHVDHAGGAGALLRRFYRSGAGARSLTEVVASGIKKLEEPVPVG